MLSFGAGTGPIFLDQVACEGGESAFLPCDRNSLIGIVREQRCGHADDAGVVCPGMRGYNNIIFHVITVL